MASSIIKPNSNDANDKAGQIRRMFNRIAPTYDLLNDCISLGMHRFWKERACQALRLKPGDQVLDVCTGTGDLVQHLLPKVGPNGQVHGLDFSEDMLAVAEQRFQQVPNVSFTQGDALSLPFPDAQFDGAIISFGLRNVIDIESVLVEMARVLRPGGWVVNLDTAPNPKLPGYWLYFSWFMPVIGRLLSKDPAAYAYLAESTRKFLTPNQLKALFEEVGLTGVEVSSFALGSVSLQAGRKPFQG